MAANIQNQIPLEIHPAHLFWTTHVTLVEGETFFDFFKTVSPEVQELLMRSVGLAVGAPIRATYVQFKNACADVVEAGMADFMLVHSLISFALSWLYSLSNPAEDDGRCEWLRDAAKFFKSQMADVGDDRKETLQSCHAQAHEAIQEMLSRTLMNQREYQRFCDELVAPLVAMNSRMGRGK